MPEPLTPDTQSVSGHSPVAVAYNFYSAINAKDWPRVWRLGGDNLGQSYAAMVRGYAHTADDLPYITEVDGPNIQLLLLAYEDNGLAQLYRGALTVVGGQIVAGTQTLSYTDRNRGFSVLAGAWSHHDGGLIITPGGLGVMSFRTFDSCASIADGCDDLVDNQILNGGLTIFRLEGGGYPTAYGRIESSTVDPHGYISVTENSHSGTLHFSDGQVFCGVTSPRDTCGA